MGKYGQFLTADGPFMRDPFGQYSVKLPEVDVVGAVGRLDCGGGGVVLRPPVGVGARDVRRRVLVAQRRARRTRRVAVVQPEGRSEGGNINK